MELANCANSEGVSATFSQSGATKSFLSANTRSNPPAHVTMSLNAGSLKTPTTSVPPPAESLSLENSRLGPSETKSLPSLPNTLSEPLPPTTASLPRPPSRFLLPPEKSLSSQHDLPTTTTSLPGPPIRSSLPARAKSMSLPPLPRRLSSPLVPLRWSGPSVPILVTAQATPLATNRVSTIALSNSIVLLIGSPPFLYLCLVAISEWGSLCMDVRRCAHEPSLQAHASSPFVCLLSLRKENPKGRGVPNS